MTFVEYSTQKYIWPFVYIGMYEYNILIHTMYVSSIYEYVHSIYMNNNSYIRI